MAIEIGSTINQLTVLSQAPQPPSYVSSSKEKWWNCRCACGAEKLIRGDRLASGKTKSCGCLTAAARKARGFVGVTKHPLYGVWSEMKTRCNNPNATRYHRYGGRGITICERWMSFPNFAADMGERPSPDHTLDRKDNDGPYSPDNCRWATWTEQNNNRAPMAHIDLWGEKLTLEEAATKLGTTPQVVRSLVGLTLQGVIDRLAAVSTPSAHGP